MVFNSLFTLFVGKHDHKHDCADVLTSKTLSRSIYHPIDLWDGLLQSISLEWILLSVCLLSKVWLSLVINAAGRKCFLSWYKKIANCFYYVLIFSMEGEKKVYSAFFDRFDDWIHWHWSLFLRSKSKLTKTIQWKNLDYSVCLDCVVSLVWHWTQTFCFPAAMATNSKLSMCI